MESNGRTQVFGLKILSDAEQQLRVIRDILRAHSLDVRDMLTPQKRISFDVGNYVFLEVPHMRSEWRFNMKGKLAPRYVGPFKM